MLTTALAALVVSAPLSFECTNDALSKMNKPALRRARNEVVARHGRKFKSKDLQRYFAAQDWYKPDPKFDDKKLSADEKACMLRARHWERSVGVLFRANEDLDGDGTKDSIFIITADKRLVTKKKSAGPCDPQPCKAKLLVNDAEIEIERRWQKGAYFDYKTPFSIADVDPKDGHKEIWLRDHNGHDVDPELFNWFVSLYDGKPVTARLDGNDYNSGQVSLQKNGQVELNRSNCPKHMITYKTNAGKFEKVKEKKDKPPEYGCPACPFVDLDVAGQWVEQGEVLRNAVGAEAAGWQRLRITEPEYARGTSRSVRVRIRESKPEITYLGAVRLRVGDVVISPKRCSHRGIDLCSHRKTMTLREGDAVILNFDVPAHAGPMWLEAYGHYEPLLAGD